MDQAKLESFVGQAVTDAAAAASAVMMSIGHRLGLYRAMKDAGPITSRELAEKTNTDERHVREWLNNQVSGGYLEYDARRGAYELTEEQAMVLANPDSPFFLVPAMDVVASMWIDEERICDSFRSGKGLGWHEHHHRLFSGTEALFRPGYRTNLVKEWIPALEGVESRLRDGARVADVGCGHGASTIAMAEAFPNSRFHGFDYHDKSVETARRRAREAGVADRVTFEVANAKSFPGDGYDLVCFMDCFHDLGDPLGAARHARRALHEGGTMLLVEPYAENAVEHNKNPVSRLFYAASAAICTPNSLSQEVGAALGAQAGEKRLSSVLAEAGFSRVRRAAATPFNLVLEARP